MKIIDSHTNLGSCFSTCYFSSHYYSANELVEEMDEKGVSHAVVSAGGKPPKAVTRNEQVIEAVHEHSKRLTGFARVNPLLENPIETLDKFVSDYGFKGIKLHPTQDAYHALDPRLDPIMERADQLDIPVLNHSGSVPFSMPGQIADLAVKYSDVPIIMAHAGKMELKQHTIPSAVRSENIYLEFSYSLPHFVREAIDAVGKNRVLFGSNWPAESMGPWIEAIEALPNFTASEKEKFLGVNAAQLLGLESGRGGG